MKLKSLILLLVVILFSFIFSGCSCGDKTAEETVRTEISINGEIIKKLDSSSLADRRIDDIDRLYIRAKYLSFHTLSRDFIIFYTERVKKVVIYTNLPSEQKGYLIQKGRKIIERSFWGDNDYTETIEVYLHCTQEIEILE
ncbi:MAG: hypothetical protein UT05_C0001G0105 [Parcubacteria group bacterium GW2011_GWF2_38_76]|nr:MAG: hypothetical protein UT05_C0001G0105 [Parcubacteria group bacterium GW2011_GWF2_38_76]HBM45919.1 hypothetical protein [Patescibacteria group bacterium]